jgi:tripartite ATP-independent transporter DctM subunit
MALFILISFIVLTLLGVPLGYGLAITALFCFFIIGNLDFLTMVSQQFFTSMDNFTYLALPFFLVAGDIMNKVGLSERLIAFSNLFFGRLRGGLAQVNIVTSVIFGGISGSAVADMAALGGIFIPSMTKHGYGKEFSTSVIIASSIIAPIIPPSIIMVIYGALMGVSIAGLFAAGIVPGLMIGGALMILVRIIAGRRNFPTHPEKFTLRRFVATTRNASWAIIMPVIILGGILFGIVTPTESAAIALAYSLFLGFIVYRNLTLKDVSAILFKDAVMMGIFALIIGSATILAWVLAMEQVPQKVADLFLSVSKDKNLILLMINFLLILAGMFMDITAALIILAPILAPLAHSVGVHPLHFGIIMCVNLNLGLMTPPVGGCLFMGMIMSRLTMGEIVKELWPFIVAEAAVLALIVFVPDLSMFMPKLLGFY